MTAKSLSNAITVCKTAWNRFWFSPVSTSNIAVFRILFGLLLIQTALLLWPDLYTWFGKDGIVSSTAINGWQAHIRLNILNLFPSSDLWLTTVFVFFVISATLLTAGFMTRLSAITVFVCLSSLHARDFLILNSGDVFMRMLCFWLVFSAAGKSLSIDSLLAKGSLGNWTTESTQFFKAQPWAQRLMQINLSLLYAQAFAKKIVGGDWQSGMAVYYSSKMTEMHRFSLYYIFDHLWTCKLLSWMVLGIELSFCTLIWVKPLRYYVLVAGVIMHLFIDWTMNIPQFEWIMIVTYILFVAPEDMDKFINWLKRLLAMLMKRLHFQQA